MKIYVTAAITISTFVDGKINIVMTPAQPGFIISIYIYIWKLI